MKRTNQLIVESAAIGSLLLAIVLGGAVTGLSSPPQWTLQNPDNVALTHDLGALALYFNTTLAYIGGQNFANASLMLQTFNFANIPASVNQTALVANSQLALVNGSLPQAVSEFDNATKFIATKEYVNATISVTDGCLQAGYAQGNFTRFSRTTTPSLAKLGVPVTQYSKSSAGVQGELSALLSRCSTLTGELPGHSLHLVISSPQKSISTGGSVELSGRLTQAIGGAGVGGQSVLFYLNGSYFGSVVTNPDGSLAGTLTIPFVYKPLGVVNALVLKNETIGSGGAISNDLNFTILFNSTTILVGDPPPVLPTFSFPVHGSLTTTRGVPLPNAPVKITFLGQNSTTTTDAKGVFASRITVPANATDGVYDVYAAFAPSGTFGPSVNFTSVQVVHLPLDLKVGAPSLTYAGLSLPITGEVSANGSGLAGAAILVDTPWGTYLGTSGSSGNVSMQVSVPIWEFALNKQVTVFAAPAQPYVAQGLVQVKVGLFNVLLIALPSLGVGMTAYELKSLGLLRRPRRETANAPVEAFRTQEQLEGMAATERHRMQSTGMLSVFYEALALAQKRFGIDFRESDTLREILAKVEKKEASGVELFASIVMTTEDFLYAPKIDEARLLEAQRQLAELKKEWGDAGR